VRRDATDAEAYGRSPRVGRDREPKPGTEHEVPVGAKGAPGERWLPGAWHDEEGL